MVHSILFYLIIISLIFSKKETYKFFQKLIEVWCTKIYEDFYPPIFDFKNILQYF